MNEIDANQEKLDKLAKHLPELEIAEKKLQEAIEFVNAIGEKWERRLAQKQATNQHHHR